MRKYTIEMTEAEYLIVMDLLSAELKKAREVLKLPGSYYLKTLEDFNVNLREQKEQQE